MLLLPIINPLCNSSTVTIHILILLTAQFHHGFFIEGLARFLKENTEDLRIQILL